MPGIITHYCCAERVLKMLEGSDINIHRDSFIWGAQGPDVFFFHRFFPWDKGVKLMEYGTRLHDESPVLLFEVMRNYMKTKPALYDETLSYELGMMCHYALDRRAHPFVNAGVEAMQESGEFPKTFNCHGQIETSLDIIMLRSELGITPVDFDLRTASPKNDDTRTVMELFYKYVLRYRFGVDADAKAISQLYPDTIRMFGLLNNRLLIKKPIIEFGEKLAGRKGSISVQLRGITEGDDYDYANIEKLPWANPQKKSEERNDSFFEIFESACDDSVKLIKGYIEALDSDMTMDELTDNLSFSHGLRIE